MCDYSVYDKTSSPLFTMTNPKPKNKIKSIRENIICFKVTLLKRRNFKIMIYKDSSLEDLYIKIYNAVYPEFSTEKTFDQIPPPNDSTYNKIPKIYNVCVADSKGNINFVPVHKLITISTYMKTKPEYFKNISYTGISTYSIYVMDEKVLLEANNKLLVKKQPTYFERLISCYK
jgi:hypothetical protein